MISFYPGPSQVHASLPQYLQEACDSGILGVNHRSAPFEALFRRTASLLRERLEVPPQYGVYFLSSATECWEVLSQSYAGLPSLHVYNGAFGEKWLQYRRLLHPEAMGFSWPFQRPLPASRLRFPFPKGLLCLTHSETSNGTCLSMSTLRTLKRRFPQALCCVDATSSMAGMRLDWRAADVWFASVQKCFGLPAGLAVMVCSPKALAWAQEQDRQEHYNSLLAIHRQALHAQTTHTPNVLGIYLLCRTLEEAPPIAQTARRIEARLDWLRKGLRLPGLAPLVARPRLQLPTVLALQAAPERIEALKAAALREGFLIGNGYGPWKADTCRIANFPAMPDARLRDLIACLRAQG